MNMSEPELNYITIPRQIRWDWVEGRITTPERNLLYELRAQGVPHGFCTVDMATLARDSFNQPVSVSYINKLLLSLKGKRYIWYKNRKGHRGTFHVQLDVWLMKNKTLKTLDKYFDKPTDRGEANTQTPAYSEVETYNPGSSQKTEEIMRQMKQKYSRKNKER